MTNAYSYIKENIRKNLKSKMIAWRASDAIVKLEKPTDIGRARILGYKDKKGFVVVRVRLKRGGHKRHRVNAARKSGKQTARKTLKMNYRWIAEQRAANKYTNLEVLNSYLMAKDGIHYFFEIILVDPGRPEIQALMPWICKTKNKGRVFRGLTSAGKKARGLRS